jgi:hypothetical protein
VLCKCRHAVRCHFVLNDCVRAGAQVAAVPAAATGKPATTALVRETGACVVDVDTLFVVTLFSMIAFVQVHKLQRFLLLRPASLQQLRWAGRQVRAL